MIAMRVQSVQYFKTFWLGLIKPETEKRTLQTYYQCIERVKLKNSKKP